MNKEINKVYIVTSGLYSDYGICSVFLKEEDANNYIECFDNQKEFFLEEYDLGPNTKGMKAYFVRVTPNYTIEERKQAPDSYGFDNSNIGKPQIDHNGNMYIRLFAKDEEHAWKIAIDQARMNRPKK